VSGVVVGVTAAEVHAATWTRNDAVATAVGAGEGVAVGVATTAGERLGVADGRDADGAEVTTAVPQPHAASATMQPRTTRFTRALPNVRARTLHRALMDELWRPRAPRGQARWHNGFMRTRSNRRHGLSLCSTLALAALVVACGGSSSGGPAAGSQGSSSGPETMPTASVTPAPTASPTPAPTPSPTPAPQPVAIVPIADFRTSLASVDATAVRSVLAGTSKQFSRIALVSSEAGPILAALDSADAAGSARVVRESDVAAVDADVDSATPTLGFVRADEVDASVRALAWGDASLFGVGRVKTLAGWPLEATMDGTNSTATFDLTKLWTAVAGGDIMLDRGVYKTVVLNHAGVDYPFSGGTAEITSRHCCSSMGWPIPAVKRLSSTQAVRQLVSGADLAMANLEGPAPDQASYHTSGLTFTFDQSLLAGLKDAGIDVVSLANNHIGNAGRQGIRETLHALDNIGIDHAGAGVNKTDARQPAMFEIDGVKVAFLAYDTIAPGFAATDTVPGSAQLSWGTGPDDVRAAKAAGAQVVIVYPHWGVEYRATPTTAERNWAHQLIDAGADLIIGNHVHLTAAMEVYKGKPIWYALGNFVFDQTWSEQTEEGMLLELTFDGGTLVQAWLHPTIILNSCQPNLLDPTTGRVVLDRVFNASKGLLSW